MTERRRGENMIFQLIVEMKGKLVVFEHLQDLFFNERSYDILV